jgi:hypothetical protein
MKRYFKCSKGHVLSLNLGQQGYKKFLRQCKKMLKVCPTCKPNNEKLEECDSPDEAC